jgi:alginate O-acetyltransferase complex protein AlgI
VFLISGFWHGASWNFIIWGAYHGAFLVIERMGLLKVLNKIKPISLIYTFVVVAIGWVFFRAETLSDALLFTQKLLGINSKGISLAIHQKELITLLVALLFAFAPPRIQPFLTNTLIGNYQNKAAIFSFMLLGLFLYFWCLGSLFATGFNPFIYFKF